MLKQIFIFRQEVMGLIPAELSDLQKLFERNLIYAGVAVKGNGDRERKDGLDQVKVQLQS